MFGPYGDGLHVDRQAFDAMLARTAEDAGATVIRGAGVKRCELLDQSWRLVPSSSPMGVLEAAALIDATGRRASIARSLGARRHVRDRLVGVAVRYGGAASNGGSTLVEAVADGWWYSAPLPSGLIVVFMTDADLCRENGYATAALWDSAVLATSYTRERVYSRHALSRPHVASAATHRLDRTGTTGRWLAAGDAAIAVDPLSGSGILRALLTGEAAGKAIAHWLVGRLEPADAYEQWLNRRFEELWAERTAYYALETRWRESPFWRRRIDSEVPPAA